MQKIVETLTQNEVMVHGFFALTGNGVNHPNDFGHSLYAKTILSVLGCRC